MKVTFFWNNRKVTAYQFTIAGMPIISMDCETVYEVAIVQQIKAARYPYMFLEEFKELLAAANLSDDAGSNFDTVSLSE